MVAALAHLGYRPASRDQSLCRIATSDLLLSSRKHARGTAQPETRRLPRQAGGWRHLVIAIAAAVNPRHDCGTVPDDDVIEAAVDIVLKSPNATGSPKLRSARK